MTSRSILLGLVLALSLAACAPRTEAPEPAAEPPATTVPEAPTETPEAPTPPAGETLTLTDPAALEADRAARQAFHLMGLYYLENGSYSANALPLDLPSGVRWMVEEISAESYRVRLTSDSVPGVAWTVTPEGVRARQVEDNQIY